MNRYEIVLDQKELDFLYILVQLVGGPENSFRSTADRIRDLMVSCYSDEGVEYVSAHIKDNSYDGGVNFIPLIQEPHSWGPRVVETQVEYGVNRV